MGDGQPGQIREGILVVDKDFSDLQMLSTLLASHGYAVQTASDGPTALAIIEADPPDLILITVPVVGLDGQEFCRQIRAQPQSHDIPVLFLSAPGDTADQVRAPDLGAVDWIRKPFRAEEVLDRVRTHLALRRTLVELKAQNPKLREPPHAVEPSTSTVVITDVHRCVAYVNSGLVAAAGYETQEAPGRNPCILELGKPGDGCYGELWETVAAGGIWRGQFHHRRKDGTSYWEQVTVAPVRDGTGRISCFVAVKEDITPRKHAELAAARRAEELAALHCIARSLEAVDCLPEALESAAGIIAGLFDASSTTVGRWTDDGLEILATSGPSGGFADWVGRIVSWPDAPSIRQPLSQGLAVALPDLQALDLPAELDQVQKSEQHAAMLVPLRVRGVLFGALAVVTDEPDRTFSPHESALAQTIAVDIAAAIENALLYDQAQELAATRERERLARDLHDSVAQTLYSVSVVAEALPRVWERRPDDARAAVRELHRLSRGALAEMRALLLELQPAMLLQKKLGELLTQLAHAAMNRAPIEITSSVVGTCHLPDEVQIALYRIAQEALNNVVRHSEASQASLDLQLEPELVVLRIRDNGRGFDPGSPRTDGFGLRNMAERARAIGARYRLESLVGQGTSVEVTWRNSAAGSLGESKKSQRYP